MTRIHRRGPFRLGLAALVLAAATLLAGCGLAPEAAPLTTSATSATPGPALAQTKAAVPKPQDKLALGEDEIKQLLLLIGNKENGKISKQEWMKFMEAEFERPDKARNGELDVKELSQSKSRVKTWESPILL